MEITPNFEVLTQTTSREITPNFVEPNTQHLVLVNHRRLRSTDLLHQVNMVVRYDMAKNSIAWLAKRDKWLRTPHGRLVIVLNAAKARAIKRGLPFDLTIEWLEKVFEDQAGKCALTGLPFLFERTAAGSKRQPFPFSPSLDRIEPAKGYVVGNTRLVCLAINVALGNFGPENFKTLALAYLDQRR